eukprot:gene42211-60446_t
MCRPEPRAWAGESSPPIVAPAAVRRPPGPAFSVQCGAYVFDCGDVRGVLGHPRCASRRGGKQRAAVVAGSTGKGLLVTVALCSTRQGGSCVGAPTALVTGDGAVRAGAVAEDWGYSELTLTHPAGAAVSIERVVAGPARGDLTLRVSVVGRAAEGFAVAVGAEWRWTGDGDSVHPDSG